MYRKKIETVWNRRVTDKVTDKFHIPKRLIELLGHTFQKSIACVGLTALKQPHSGMQIISFTGPHSWEGPVVDGGGVVKFFKVNSS